MTEKFLIVGGGVIGLSIAEHLVRKGKRCVLLDQGPFAKEASWAGAGYLDLRSAAKGSDAFFDLCKTSFNLFPEWTSRLHQETGIDPEWTASGSLDLVFGDQEGTEVQDLVERLASRGLKGEWLSGEEARGLESGLSQDLLRAYRFKATAQVRPPRLNRALLTYLQATGAELKELEPVEDFLLEGRRVLGVRTAKGFHEADRVILAAGAWTEGLTSKLGVSLPVRPFRGQVVMYRPPTVALGHILFKGTGRAYTYLVPRRDGHIYVGSTLEDVGFDKSTTPEGMGKLRNGAARILPALSQQWIEDSWAGLRPSSADGLPYLGPVPGVEGLWAATGHFTHGLLLSAVTGELLSQDLLGERTSLEMGPFRLERVLRPVRP